MQRATILLITILLTLSKPAQCLDELILRGYISEDKISLAVEYLNECINNSDFKAMETKAKLMIDNAIPGNAYQIRSLLKSSYKLGNKPAKYILADYDTKNGNIFSSAFGHIILTNGVHAKNPEAMISLSEHYRGTDKKQKRSLNLLLKAKSLGSIEATYRLGKFYSDKSNKYYNDSLAIVYFLQGASQDNSLSMYELGKLLLSRDNSNHSLNSGVYYLVKAAEAKDKNSIILLNTIRDSLITLDCAKINLAIDDIITMATSSSLIMEQLRDKTLGCLYSNDNPRSRDIKELFDRNKLSYNYNPCVDMVKQNSFDDNIDYELNCLEEEMNNGNIEAIRRYLINYCNGKYQSSERNIIDTAMSSGEDCCYIEFSELKSQFALILAYKIDEIISSGIFDHLPDNQITLFNEVKVSDVNLKECIDVLLKINSKNIKPKFKVMFSIFITQDDIISEAELSSYRDKIRAKDKSSYIEVRDFLVDNIQRNNIYLINDNIKSDFLKFREDDGSHIYSYQIESKQFDRSVKVLSFFSDEVDSLNIYIPRYHLAKAKFMELNGEDASKYYDLAYFTSKDEKLLRSEHLLIQAYIMSEKKCQYYNPNDAKALARSLIGSIYDRMAKSILSRLISETPSTDLVAIDLDDLERQSISGDIESTLKLGEFYYNDKSASTNPEKALDIYKRIQARSGKACYMIAVISKELGKPNEEVLKYLAATQAHGYEPDDLIVLISKAEQSLDKDAIFSAMEEGQKIIAP